MLVSLLLCFHIQENSDKTEIAKHSMYYRSRRINVRYVPASKTNRNRNSKNKSIAAALKSRVILSVSLNFGIASGFTDFWDIPSGTPIA